MLEPHTLDSAPEASRPTLEALSTPSGSVPDAVARLASSPELLNGFLAMSRSFEQCTLDAVSREVVIMTVAVHNGCGVCVAMHTGKLRRLGADPQVITDLRADRAPADPRLRAIRQFTLTVLATAGAVGDEALDDLLAHGYSERNALEVVFGIGTYTMSTFANRLVGAA